MERLADGRPSQDLAQYLQRLKFPARKDQVVHAARQGGAPADMVDILQELPRNEFASFQELLDLYPHLGE